MRKAAFLPLVLFSVWGLFLVSCSNSNDETYYFSDSAAAGPEESLENQDPGMPQENVAQQNAQSTASYTQRRPVSSEPKPWASSSNQQAAPTVRYPTGTKVSGKSGLVKSPYAPYAGDVDVKGIPAGTQVKCPYTGKIFIVP